MAAESTHEGPDPLVGQLIGERYRVLAPLGRGGMGAVYRVEHVMMKKELACKLLHPELGRLDEVARRFEREAEAAARLEHPNIINVTDFGRTADGQLFLVMELLHGPSLAQVIRPDGVEGHPLGAGRAVHIVKQVLRALEHAHASGIVHRDLKPENIVLIERDGEKDVVKLLDFGIAKITSGPSDGGHKEALTQAGVVFGTPEYLSPEQAMGEEADGRADLYAAGVMLYEMLTGRRPFEAASKVEVLSMHLTRDARPMREVAPQAGVPPALEGVVAHAMAKKRAERFGTAQEFLHSLDSGMAARSSSRMAVPVGARLSTMTRAVPEGWRWTVQRAREAGVPWPRAFAGGALGLVVALLLLIVVAARRHARPRPPTNDIAEDVARAEQLLKRGELDPARAVLQQLLAAHPDSARVRYLYGNLDFADGDRARSLEDYAEALRLDPAYDNDPALRANLRALLDRRVEGPLALALLESQIGKPALDDIVDCAKTCKDGVMRRRAAEAAARMGAPLPDEKPLAKAEKIDKPKPPPASPAGGDELVDRLLQGRNCRERKVAALEIIAKSDPKYLDTLKEARERRGGFLGLQRINGCMRRDLDAAIRKLEAEK